MELGKKRGKGDDFDSFSFLNQNPNQNHIHVEFRTREIQAKSAEIPIKMHHTQNLKISCVRCPRNPKDADLFLFFSSS